MIQEFLAQPIIASLLVLVTQVLFLYFRTLNVIYASSGNLVAAVSSELAVSICRLLSISVGVNSVLTGDFITALFYLLGAVIGTWWAMKTSKLKT
jgi:hypothetical protein